MASGRRSWPLASGLAVFGLSLAVLFSLIYVVIGGAGGAELNEALHEALGLWSLPPWSAVRALCLRFSPAVELSGTSMDPAVAVFGWTAILYGVPYLMLALLAQIVATPMKKGGTVPAWQMLGSIAGLAGFTFVFAALLMPISWVAMFIRSLAWASSGSG